MGLGSLGAFLLDEQANIIRIVLVPGFELEDGRSFDILLVLLEVESIVA